MVVWRIDPNDPVCWVSIECLLSPVWETMSNNKGLSSSVEKDSRNAAATAALHAEDASAVEWDLDFVLRRAPRANC